MLPNKKEKVYLLLKNSNVSKIYIKFFFSIFSFHLKKRKQKANSSFTSLISSKKKKKEIPFYSNSFIFFIPHDSGVSLPTHQHPTATPDKISKST